MKEQQKKKNRAIMFNAEMVGAILQGRKTQTRRIIKNNPTEKPTCVFVIERTKRKYHQTFRFCDTFDHPDAVHIHPDAIHIRCPYGPPGRRLWVKENYAVNACYDHLKPSQLPPISADQIWWSADKDRKDTAQKGKIRPSIFLPRALSRIELEIDSIAVERLNRITEDDACKEGIEMVEHNCFENYLKCTQIDERPGSDYVEDPIGSFRSLWKSLHGKESWNANPWVWVIEFKLVAK